MGINMDIRNEPEYAFLDLADLDDTTKNEIMAIIRPNTGLDSLKLPWDIGEKVYDLHSEVAEGQVEDESNQWPHYGMAESIPGYDGCVTTSPMMATPMPPGHHYAGPQMIVYGDGGFGGMGAPFANSAAGDPNAFSLVGGFPYGPPQPMFSAGTEMMSQPPSRDSERRGGRGRGGGGGGKRDYNRIMNSNNDMQSYAVQGQYSQMVPMSHSSGALYPFTAQGHPAAGPPIFMPPAAAGYPQAPQLHHNSHPAATAYGHHPSGYPAHPHSPGGAKYRGQGQATYYNQDQVSMKSPAQKHHEKRGHHHQQQQQHQQMDICSVPPFRHSSISETESPKRTYGKTVYVSSSNANYDVRNATGVHGNSTTRYPSAKKVTFSASDAVKAEAPEVAAVKEQVPVEPVAEKKETPPAAAVDGGAVVKDKTGQEKEAPAPAETKVFAVKTEPLSPPRAAKPAEHAAEAKETTTVAVKTEKITETKETTLAPKTEKVAEAPATPVVIAASVSPPAAPVAAAPVAAAPVAAAPVAAAPVAAAPPVAAPAPPPGKSWASIVQTGGPPGDAIRSPPPITKLPVARDIPVNYPPAPPPAETATPPKSSIQETVQLPRNEIVVLPVVRNNAEPPAPKPAERSPWAETKAPAEAPPLNNLKDPAVFRMGELLLKYQMDKQTVSLLPRGLTNRSNYCYINSILQALLACPPFYNLLMALPHPRNPGKNSSTPLIDNMVRFVREFSPLADGARMPRKDKSQKRGEETAVDVQFGVAFEPSYVYTMLKNTSCAGVFSVEGRQEDAEEFLSCLLNGISDEMLELMKLVNAESNDAAPAAAEPNANHNNDEEGWKVMGPKNKGSITRCTEFGRTPLSDIFRGQLRSRVIRIQEETTDNVQPFFTLQLDIEKAESVADALETLFGRDRVEGMTCSKTKQQIEAWKQVSLEELPVILILHLKWFDYKLDGCSKILKRVEFPIDLKLDPKKLLSPNVGKKLTRKQNQYKLFAVTYHDGKEASKGHYVTDAFHVGYGAWVRYDDSSVKGIYEMDVLNPSPPRVPYLLYYRRCDTIGNNPPNTPRTR